MDMRQVFAIATAHAGTGARDAPLDPERVLCTCGAVVYEWDLATDRLTWGPNLRAVFGLDRRHRLACGRAYNALVVAASGDSRDEAVLASGQADHGNGVAYRCRYVVAFGPRKFVIEDSGHWFAGPDGRPAWAQGLVRAFPLGRRAADPERGTSEARPEPARERLLRALTARLHDPAAVRTQVTVMVAAVERPENADLADPARAVPSEAEMARLEARLRHRLKRRDFLVQLTPARLCIVLNACDVDHALAAARALGGGVADLVGPGRQALLRIGAVTAGERSGDATALLERAEEAADHAKVQGESVWRLPPRLRRRAVARSKSPSPLDLIAALNGRRVRLARRPLIELGARRQAAEHVWHTGERPLAAPQPGLEAVQAEVTDADGSFAGAAALAPLAERLGLSPLLDHRVLELALKALRADPEAQLMMTLSAATLLGPGWLATLSAYLGAHRDVVDRLVVAIDERAFAVDPATGQSCVPATTVAANLSAMKALGLGVAIAGYGGGRLNLADLSDLSADLVTINRALVAGAVTASQGRFVLRSLVAGTRHLGLPAFGEAGDDAGLRSVRAVTDTPLPATRAEGA
ncbi:EAL domain-containing protein [Chelatococcus reniformis]|uniref:GGDEF-domain containing protein n=1 Tax=Chelatococcus reniformis TaxID=1494448 RepID=A0A916UY14_9HYPH|nr:EAL domain-containing protein [Chelatococcus reniformis]GGC92853.1 GGDEF-domain containing protein [Chelatococcus reniformis]